MEVLRSTIVDKERIILEQKELVNFLKGKIYYFESKPPVVTYESYADATKANISKEIKINYPEITLKTKHT